MPITLQLLLPRLKKPPTPLPVRPFFPIKLLASLASAPLIDALEKLLNMALKLVVDADLVGPCGGEGAFGCTVGGPTEVFLNGGTPLA